MPELNTQKNKKELTARVSRFIEDQTADNFDQLALAIFRFQYKNIPALGAYWRYCGVTPDKVGSHLDIPPIALNVFKNEVLFAGTEPDQTFRTSGTSGKGRGAALFDQDDLALMTTSILTNAEATLFADSVKTRFMLMVPSPTEAPDVIMAHGMSQIAAKFGLDAPFYAVSKGGFLAEEAISFLRDCINEQTPVTLIGGSFGFVNFVDRVQPKLGSLPLPPGSRLMDAGGFKGRSRELDRDSFVEMMGSFFALTQDQCFNLYGLTELASQFYSQGNNPKSPPHWTKVRVCEPLAMTDVAPGEQGVAVLYDLANVARPMAILTDDIAISHGAKGFDLLGRASGSAPRGCSLSMEDMR